METKDGRDPAPYLNGPLRVSLVRDLALGTYTHRQLADKYGRGVDAISQFASRNASEINDVRLEICEPLELWGVRKEEQIALIQRQIIDTACRIESGELSAAQEKGWRALQLKAVHQLSEITGQLPSRTVVDLGQATQVIHEIGVDMAKAFPQGAPASNSVAEAAPAPAPEPEQEPEPDRFHGLKERAMTGQRIRLYTALYIR